MRVCRPLFIKAADTIPIYQMNDRSVSAAICAKHPSKKESREPIYTLHAVCTLKNMNVVSYSELAEEKKTLLKNTHYLYTVHSKKDERKMTKSSW